MYAIRSYYAAILQPRVDEICRGLSAGEADRDKLDEPRWQAGYDLAMGRALALKVRTDGYNAALAQAKRFKKLRLEKEQERAKRTKIRPAQRRSRRMKG